MNMQDVALVAYRLVALWFAASGINTLAETLFTWNLIWARSSAAFADTVNPPTETGFLIEVLSGVTARVIVGLLLWWAAPAMARHTPLGQPRWQGPSPCRADLFSAATFLVGVWLVVGALPAAAYSIFMATRAGVPAYDDGLGGARLAQTLAQLLLGVALVRGGWLVDIALWGRGQSQPAAGEPPVGPG